MRNLYMLHLPTGAQYPPDAHQIEAYEHLCDNPRAALFLGMSLMKTVTTLTYLYDMHYREAAIAKTLVIAPNKVARFTWPDEIKTWAHLDGLRYSVVEGAEKERLAALAKDAEVYLISADNFSWLHDQYLYQRVSAKSGLPYGEWLGHFPFDCIVIDELSIFKSPSSERFKKLRRCLKLGNVEYRVGLTGTPSPNGLKDLWAQLFFLDEGERLGATWGDFETKYFNVRGNGQIVYEWKPKPGTAKIIAHKIKDICLTMQTRDRIVLPPLYDIKEMIKLDPFDREQYDRLEEDYILALGEDEDDAVVTVKTAADLTNKLLQASSGALYEDGTKVWHEINRAKINRLTELLAEHSGENILLVYQFRHELERLKRDFPHARELRTAQDLADWNAGKIKVMLIHPASAGHGLNLQFGGWRMIWFTCTWNLEHDLQTVARLLRRGQEHAVYVHRLIVEGTRDIKVARRVLTKDTNQQFLLNEIKELRRKWLKKN